MGSLALLMFSIQACKSNIFVWYGLGVEAKKERMTPLLKSAWLVGLYTAEIDSRVADLGFQITKVVSNIIEEHASECAPELLVFSEDKFTDGDSMYAAKDFFPDSIIVSLPALNSWQEDEYAYSWKERHEPSVSRLVSSILEREHRWSN
jgi:hypothetical protein